MSHIMTKAIGLMLALAIVFTGIPGAGAQAAARERHPRTGP